MSLMTAERPEVLHTLPGRLRLHLPNWSGQGKQNLEIQIHQITGVRHVQATPATGNVLVNFDPGRISEQTLLHEIQQLDLTSINTEKTHSSPPAVSHKQGRTVRARIAVRGLDRDPQVATRITTHLKNQPGVHVAKANELTGRVLIEFDEHEADLDDLIAQIAQLELPELPGEDRPAFPLDPKPLIQSATRTLGATLGLSLLSFRRLTGFSEPLPGASIALQTSSIISILQGIPPIRYGLRRLLGRTAADLLLNIPGIISLTLAGSPIGLAVTGSESLRLLTEVQARRSAWRRHEERIEHAPSAQPDEVISLERGERTPLAAKVLEGTGTAIGRDGMPQPVFVGKLLPPGARLYGGPFVVRLRHEESFNAFKPQPRPAPVTPSLFERYHRIIGLASLAYAGISGLLTFSFTSTLTALLLVNARTAAIGVDNAELGTSARVLRAGVTVVGTRTHRALRLPSLLLFDSARLLSDRLEIAGIIPLNDAYEPAELLAMASGTASAAGSPWGGIFRATDKGTATDGHFDGRTARAVLEGTHFVLGPVEDWASLPEAASLRQSGHYVLVLKQEQEERPEALSRFARI
ncbi:hypothetical protein EPA93_46790 [Ktedonosporobacter rubrisoli]|uniref:HMA domain-containing protein n=1 Tax=Ktedonosporobacter rubrisoli TaxID=2509675 RepID=A0A4P6K457_KTERU|nr:hypothetical protein [Ktedonosporobacter rubrisoli]QBD83077.1 hypothetical protein EPA93_46790 [Ktedonosporobacter rubrisoli]